MLALQDEDSDEEGEEEEETDEDACSDDSDSDSAIEDESREHLLRLRQELEERKEYLRKRKEDFKWVLQSN